MLSVTKHSEPQKARSRHLADTFEIWNRKIHYYLGLYFLFFLWLFAISGFLLNHPAWSFSKFIPDRRQTTFERPIQAPPPGGDLAQARDIMRQIGLLGEIEWTTTRTDYGHFDFRVSRPGHVFDIKTDLVQNRAAVQRIEDNMWGIMFNLHTFTGVRMTDARYQRDWTLTTVWALSMDAVAAGLVIMVLSGFYMWWGLRQKRLLGLIALALGFLSCGFFAVGLRWIY
jgi:hypothetical protein